MSGGYIDSAIETLEDMGYYDVGDDCESSARPASSTFRRLSMELNYIDPECTTAQDTALHEVSGFVAGKAYNEICRMLGGRWPDARLQNEAPFAHEFFMALFASNVQHEGPPREAD